MPDRVLTLRELNRATLARQLLLERASLSAPAAIERLVGLQAQQPKSPYIALWTRLRDFRRDDLARPIEDRTVVKATLMRTTLHLVTAEDYPWLRATIQPVLMQGVKAISLRRDAGIDVAGVVATVKRYIAEEPRTFAEMSKMLTELAPGSDPGAMRYAARMHIPMVQVPIPGGWSYPGNPRFTLAEAWLGRSPEAEEDLPELISRYLAGFGPATVADIQTWSGLQKLKPVVDALKPKLVTYRDERKRELFDLPDTPLPEPATPAPVRFLPEYDNLLLSHKDRSRIVPEAHRANVFLPGLRVGATFLVDGFVAGGWAIERAKQAATLVLRPFEPLTKQTREALIEEAEQLVRFLEADAQTFAVRFAE